VNRTRLKQLLEDIYTQKVTPEEGLQALKKLPYDKLDFAHIDHHRSLRQGFPEVIYCQGKTAEQVVSIVERMLEQGHTILATRAREEIYERLKQLDARVQYNPLARTIVLKEESPPRTAGRILVASAGTSDIPVAEEAVVTAETLGSSVDRLYDVGVAGIHRLLNQQELLFRARVIVVVAGMDGALPSVIGGLVDKPVIAVPTSVGYGASFGGIAALLTMLNSCAAGVATVNIDNGFGAGYIAHFINMLGEKDTPA
jgi:hypothetical protein